MSVAKIHSTRGNSTHRSLLLSWVTLSLHLLADANFYSQRTYLTKDYYCRLKFLESKILNILLAYVIDASRSTEDCVRLMTTDGLTDVKGS